MIYIVMIIGIFLLYSIGNRLIDQIFNSKNVSKVSYFKKYVRKNFMTEYEKDFYSKLCNLSDDYLILPQVNLASIIQKQSNMHYNTELFRNIDFGIFDKKTLEVLLLIELNDKTHSTDARKKRDRTVKEICIEVGIKLITFYSSYPNETTYVINRIQKEIQLIKENL